MKDLGATAEHRKENTEESCNMSVCERGDGPRNPHHKCCTGTRTWKKPVTYLSISNIYTYVHTHQSLSAEAWHGPSRSHHITTACHHLDKMAQRDLRKDSEVLLGMRTAQDALINVTRRKEGKSHLSGKKSVLQTKHLFSALLFS